MVLAVEEVVAGVVEGMVVADVGVVVVADVGVVVLVVLAEDLGINQTWQLLAKVFTITTSAYLVLIMDDLACLFCLHKFVLRTC